MATTATRLFSALWPINRTTKTSVVLYFIPAPPNLEKINFGLVSQLVASP
jgi:hypothetical protein